MAACCRQSRWFLERVSPSTSLCHSTMAARVQVRHSVLNYGIPFAVVQTLCVCVQAMGSCIAPTTASTSFGEVSGRVIIASLIPRNTMRLSLSLCSLRRHGRLRQRECRRRAARHWARRLYGRSGTDGNCNHSFHHGQLPLSVRVQRRYRLFRE